jgi:hypothetical protein
VEVEHITKIRVVLPGSSPSPPVVFEPEVPPPPETIPPIVLVIPLVMPLVIPLVMPPLGEGVGEAAASYGVGMLQVSK